jgi:16S rRNA (guanine1207-N2)-methyltransferase
VQRSEETLKLETHPGIFSWEALDEGTALLLDHLEIKPGLRVWDVGCGYGAIGLSAVLAGADFVALSDVNLLGVDYTLRNAKRNGYGNGQTDGTTDMATDKRIDVGEQSIHVFAAEGLDFASQSSISNSHFDLIVSNPAFHQGREVDKSMADQLITSAPRYLAPSGRLVLVANRFLNYDKFMRDHFRHVSRIAETNKFHVIEAQN